VEAWARTARYGALFRAVEDTGSAAAAVGHTADDQAETVLLALVRGGGLESLGGMAPVSPPVARPLLETTREETVAFCRALRLRPRADPMNRDPAYLRVAVREEVIPVLEDRLGRGVRSSVVRTAALLREDARFLDELADEAERRIVSDGDPERRLLRVAALRRTPPALAGRVVRRALLDLGVAPESAHVASVLELADARPKSRISLPQGLIARRDREYVALLRPSPRGRSGVRSEASRPAESGEASDGNER